MIGLLSYSNKVLYWFFWYKFILNKGGGFCLLEEINFFIIKGKERGFKIWERKVFIGVCDCFYFCEEIY